MAVLPSWTMREMHAGLPAGTLYSPCMRADWPRAANPSCAYAKSSGRPPSKGGGDPLPESWTDPAQLDRDMQGPTVGLPWHLSSRFP